MDKTVGIIGGGQLGRMLALAAYPLGARVVFLEPATDAPMSTLATQICGAYADEQALEQLACEADVVTYEFENVPIAAAEFVARFAPIFPPHAALRVSQDRWDEKSFFNGLDIPTPKFARVDSVQDLRDALDMVGLPAVLKTRRMGYDGKGQMVVESFEDAGRALNELGGSGLIVEAFVPFTREVSMLAVRGQDGACAFYPLVENHHRDGILRWSLAPASDGTPQLEALAQEYERRVLTALNYVGVQAIEFFQVGEELLASEMAPRVHNSGHWTIEGAVTSQFENHIRALLGLPLGSTEMRGHSAMVNLIGTLPDLKTVLEIPGAHLHLYDKAPRPGRKLGHVTVVADDMGELQGTLVQVLERVERESTRNFGGSNEMDLQRVV